MESYRRILVTAGSMAPWLHGDLNISFLYQTGPVQLLSASANTQHTTGCKPEASSRIGEKVCYRVTDFSDANASLVIVLSLSQVTKLEVSRLTL